MTDKKLSSQEFRDRLADHFEKQPELLRGAKAKEKADGMAKHYAQGEDLLSQAAATLREIAETHPDPEKKKAADLAIKKLDSAKDVFSLASTCASKTWNADIS